MELTLLTGDAASLQAGYSCPCGCTPSVTYARGAEPAEEGCCCGNHFAVGPGAAARLVAKPGFRQELLTFDSPWGERLEASWLVGPSVHEPAVDHDHEHVAHPGEEDRPTRAIDPVCGMTVGPDAARANGLYSSHKGGDYFFCGKGCKLEFDDDPERYLDPSYVPSM